MIILFRSYRLICLFLLNFIMVSGAVFADDVSGEETRTLTIGSKSFSESHILAEIMAQLLESEGFTIQRRLGLGGTLIAYEALKNKEIDLYPEYTGTISQAILKAPELKDQQIEKELKKISLRVLDGFGFNNTYAMALSEKKAKQLNLKIINDLRNHPSLTLAFSHEFLNRDDGWPALKKKYTLPQDPKGIEHALAYSAIQSGDIDITDAYSTDGELQKYSLVLLDDNQNFFPEYLAVPLVHQGLSQEAINILSRLSNKISESEMQAMNAQVSLEQKSPSEVARQFLNRLGILGMAHSENSMDEGTAEEQGIIGSIQWDLIFKQTLIHIKLTGISVLLACLIAIPLSVIVSCYSVLARVVLYLAGLIQTIPSLALLALLIPILGLGQVPAIVALFLYSLLPIVRNTLIGLSSIDPLLKQVGVAMGLSSKQRLRKIDIPLAMPMIFAGVKTAAIISLGTATLAAFVGAQGLGEPIITGLTLNQPALILHGAIPAILLAILTEILFEWGERRWIPQHLKSTI